jgi:hypothetical protein
MLSLKTQGKTNTSGYFQNYFNDLFAKKRKLVKLELDLIDRVRADWQDILGSTVTDRTKAESSIKDCYRYAGLDTPKIIWVDCPLNVVQISIDFPYLCDVSDLFINEVWQSELEIQKSIDPDAIAQVLAAIDLKHPIENLQADLQLDSISGRSNDLVMSQIDNIYGYLTGRNISVPFQNYQIGYLGYFDYFLQIGLNIPQMQPAIDLAKSCGWCWTFEKLTILTPKPAQIEFDRLGNINSIVYNDVNILNDLHHLS